MDEPVDDPARWYRPVEEKNTPGATSSCLACTSASCVAVTAHYQKDIQKDYYCTSSAIQRGYYCTSSAIQRGYYCTSSAIQRGYYTAQAQPHSAAAGQASQELRDVVWGLMFRAQGLGITSIAGCGLLRRVRVTKAKQRSMTPAKSSSPPV
jgi:hypothetical protein